MTENWQAEPSPWLSPGREQPEPGPQAGEPAASQGPAPMRLHVNGDVVSIGQPPMADPPRLTPVAGPAGISVPQIAAPLEEGQFAPPQFSVPSQFAPPPAPVEVPPPPPPPFLDASYGANSYAQSPYAEAPYTASTYAPPYADKPLDNQPFVEAPAPPTYSPPSLVEPVRPEPVYTPGSIYTPEPVYTPEPDFKPEPVRAEPVVAEQLSAPEPKAYIEPRYIEPTSIDSPTTTLPVTYAESQYSQLTPVPHPSYQQRPAPPAEPPLGAPTTSPSTSPSSVPAAPPIVGGSDGHSTMLVAVGTVQPRAPQPPATVEDAERVLGAAVDSLDADPDLYSIGTVTDGAVCLIPDEGRWAVFLADAGQRRFAGTFDDPMMAAVHFAGVLLLASAERGAIPKPSAPAALPAQSAGPIDQPGQNGQNGQYNADVGQPGQPGHYAGQADQAPGAGGDPLAQFLAGPPIAPLAGDPPTTLYTEHRLTVLTPGTEVDRFGDQLGNTVYAARTRYPHRSLPPDYIEREYRVYRVRNPLRALTGTAIPWFGQPGGGIAYLLPRPIADLLREGVLVELPAATVAPS